MTMYFQIFREKTEWQYFLLLALGTRILANNLIFYLCLRVTIKKIQIIILIVVCYRKFFAVFLNIGWHGFQITFV